MAKKTAARTSRKPAPKPAVKARKVVARKPSVIPVPKAKGKPPAKPVFQKKNAKVHAAAPTKALLLKKEKAPPKLKVKKLPVRELRMFKDLLQKLRDRVVDEITFLAGDNLNRSQRDSSGDLSSYSFHMADQGTDNFDREFALNLVSSEQDVLYEIDEALRRIDMGTYGICELTNQAIEKERLKALPHTRHCLAAQAALEKGKARYRPFGPTIGQMAQS